MKVGDTLNGNTILAIRPYSGKYGSYFAWIVTLARPLGPIEMAANDRDCDQYRKRDDKGDTSHLCTS